MTQRVNSQICLSLYNSFGLTYRILTLLSEYDLIKDSLAISDYVGYDNFWYNNELWGLIKPEVPFPQSLEDFQNIPISGYGLTSIGRELFHIVDLNTPPQYWDKISEFLQGFYNIKLYKYPKSSKKPVSDASIDKND